MWLQESKEWQELSLILRDYLNETVSRIAQDPNAPSNEEFQLIAKIVIKKFRRYQKQERYNKLAFMRLAVSVTTTEEGMASWNIAIAAGPCEILEDFQDDFQMYAEDLNDDYSGFSADRLGPPTTRAIRLIPLDTEVH